MNEKTAEEFLNWAHTITSEVQNILNESGRVASAEQVGEAMRELGEAVLTEVLKP